MMNIESHVLGYQKYLASLESKPIDNSQYSSLIQRYVEILASRTIDSCIETVMGVLSEYIGAIRQMKETHKEIFEKVNTPDPFLSDVDWVIGTIIKEKKYRRLSSVSVEKLDTDLRKEVAQKALQMPYEDAVNFMGELAGAWVLAYPGALIQKYEEFMKFGEPPSEDECIYALVRLIEIHFMEWRK